MDYAILSADGAAVVEVRAYAQPLDPGQVKHHDGLPLARPIEDVNAAFDPATQVRTGPAFEILPDRVRRVWTVRAKTAPELAADQRTSDLAVLREAGKDVVIVLTELIPALIAKGVIAAGDFAAATRQAYQDLKAIADRVKAG